MPIINHIINYFMNVTNIIGNNISNKTYCIKKMKDLAQFAKAWYYLFQKHKVAKMTSFSKSVKDGCAHIFDKCIQYTNSNEFDFSKYTQIDNIEFTYTIGCYIHSSNMANMMSGLKNKSKYTIFQPTLIYFDLF